MQQRAIGFCLGSIFTVLSHEGYKNHQVIKNINGQSHKIHLPSSHPPRK